MTGSDRNRLLLGSTPLFAGMMARLATQFFVAIAATKYLGLATFGLLAAVLALTRFAAPLVELGGRILYYQGATGSDWDSDEEHWWGLAISRTVLALVFAVAAGGIGAATVGLPFVDSMLAAIGTTVPLVWLTMTNAHLVRNHRVFAAATCDVTRAVSVTLPLLAFLSDDRSLRTWTTLIAVGGVLFSLGAGVYMSLGGRGSPAMGFRPSRWMAEAAAGLAIGIGLLAQAGSMLLDQFILGAISTPENAGVYSLAATAAFAALTPLSALNELTMPRFLGDDQVVGLRRSYVTLTIAMMVTASLLSPLGWWLADVLFDIEQADRIALLTVLLIVSLSPRALALPSVMSLHRGNHHRKRAQLDLTSLVINLTLNLALIPSLGYWGALIATAISELVFFVLVTRTVQQMSPAQLRDPALEPTT